MNACIRSLVLTACAAPLQAEELGRSWYWHAFASQAAIHSSDNNYFGQSDDSLSTDFRELGLIVGGQPLKDLHLVGQLLSRRAGEVDKTDLQLDYIFANYSLYSGLDGRLGVKAGRLRMPLGFFNETRDVAHTRPSILLPQAVYSDRFRDISFSREGAQLFGSYQQGVSTFSWDLSYGKLRVQDDDFQEVLGVDTLPGKVDTPFTPVARILWDWDMGRVRLGMTYADFSASYHAASVDMFQDADLSFDYWVFSAEYNAADWSLISEYSSFNSNLGELVPNVRYSSRGHGYYVQGVYRFSPEWDAFARWDLSYTDDKNRDDHRFYTKDFTTGAGWRPSSNWLVRAEWHLIDGTSALSSRENTELSRFWQMVLFQVSYRL